ncbi:MAG: hypothetical protein ACHQQS_17065 [Thermoanaerobaculales bacterium]
MPRRSSCCWQAAAVVLALSALTVSSALAAGDADTLQCPNEATVGFRTYLPDCRAYELVTPPFKVGQPLKTVVPASGGSHVLYVSLGAFAGTESDSNGEEGAVNLLAREPSGWEASAIAPPSSQFPYDSLLDASPDLGRTLWALRRASQPIEAEDFYVREAGDALAMVGPAVPPAAAEGPPAGSSSEAPSEVRPVGASSDLSHMFFELFNGAQLWPGDTTVTEGEAGASLYGYTGTGNQRPYLLASNGEGRLVSDCGISLGSHGEGDTYNAVSRSGEIVYFTAYRAEGKEGKFCTQSGEGTGPSVNELYARLGGEDGEVVAISEPSARWCRHCQVEHQASGEFAGASEDGERAFFLTRQELLPGAIGQNLYEYDFGAPQAERILRVSNGVASPGVVGVARVSEDGSHVYFVAAGQLTREPRAGGCAAALSAPELAEEELTREGRCRAKAGADNLYVFEQDAAHPQGRVRFIATLSSGDSPDWAPTDNRPVQATPSGRFVVFQSTGGLLRGETGGRRQVFKYDAQEETLVRVSVGQAGYARGTASADVHGASIGQQLYTSAYNPTSSYSRLAVSEDGSTVVFDSAGALTPGSEAASDAGAMSVYEYRGHGTLSGGDVYLISDGVDVSSPEPGGEGGAVALGMDPSGQDVYFASGDPLVPEVLDTERELYDARVDGGFPGRSSPPQCEGELCQGAPSAPPSLAAPGSASAPGGGNLTSSPPVETDAKSKTKPKAKAQVLTRAQQRARALKACKRDRGKRRATCEAQVKRRYPARPTKPTA